MGKHFLIIEARFYTDIADELVKGATAELDSRDATYERIEVPGVLEAPAALAMAIQASETLDQAYDGYVMLGCVIRGETSHYDIVANESARAIMDLATKHQLALGNGILTVENKDQAWARAGVENGNKGGFAANAAAHMVELRSSFGLADV